jgi:hypothetical protein
MRVSEGTRTPDRLDLGHDPTQLRLRLGLRKPNARPTNSLRADPSLHLRAADAPLAVPRLTTGGIGADHQRPRPGRALRFVKPMALHQKRGCAG